MKKIKTKAISLKKALQTAFLTATMAMTTVLPVLAADGDTVASPDVIIGNVIGIVCLIARYTGVVLLATAIVGYVSAHRNEDPEGQNKAVKQLIVAILLIAIKFLVDVLLGVTGTGITVTMPNF